MENEKIELLEEAQKPYNIRHRCFHFAKEIVSFERQCKYDRIHFSIFDQLIRSSTSIGANVVEGASGSSKRDFKNFLFIALKSANETKYWLCLIRDTLDVDANKTTELIKEADGISKILAAIVLSAS